jgi:hypothetical protein
MTLANLAKVYWKERLTLSLNIDGQSDGMANVPAKKLFFRETGHIAMGS